jgi:hypothetical protein
VNSNHSQWVNLDVEPAPLDMIKAPINTLFAALWDIKLRTQLNCTQISHVQ